MFNPKKLALIHVHARSFKPLIWVFIGIAGMMLPSLAATITTAGSGNWNSTTNNAPWPGGVVPQATDSIVIASGHNLSTNGNRTCAGMHVVGTITISVNNNILTINGGFGGSGTLAGSNNNRQIVISGDWTFNPATAPSVRNTITFSGTANQRISGKLSTSSIFVVNKPNGSSLTLQNDITVATFTMTAGVFDPQTFLLTAGTRTFTDGTLRVGATTWAGNYSGAITQPTTGIIDYYRAGSQTVNNVTYPGTLRLSGSGAKTLGTSTTSVRNLYIKGTASATTVVGLSVTANLEVGDSTNAASFTAAAFALTVTGTTTVANASSLIISSGTGTKTFTGAVTVASGGIWNNSGNSGVLLSGGLTNNGTFTSGSGVYTFQTNNQSINGTVSISNLTVTTIVVTNNAALTVGTALAGSGSMELGVNSSLTLSGTISITTFDASANGSVVTYNGGSPQTAKAGIYDNLTVNNTNGVTLGGATTVEVTLTLTTGNLLLSTFNLTVQGSVVGATSTRYVRTNSTGRLIQTVGASNVSYPVGNSAYNPIIISNSGTSDDLGIRVIDAVTSPAPNNTALLVNRFWNLTEAIAGGSNLAVTMQWNSGEPNASYASGTVVKVGYYNGTGWSEVVSSQNGSGPFTASGSINASGDDLTTERTFGVGKDAGFVAGPTITVSSVTSFGNQCINTTSAEKTYTVSGVNLTANIIITPPAGYQISTTSGSGFVSSPSTISLTQTGGVVSATTIFVRFNPTTVATFNNNITHTSTGATTRNVALTGSGVNSAPTVTTPTSASVGSSTATLGGNITDIGCNLVTVRGIEYSTTNNFVTGTGTQVSQSGSFNAGVFTIDVTGLASSTTYYYRAYATNSGGTTYTSQGSFSTVAVARYSVGTSPMNWNNTANWSATSGGPGGASVPTTGNAVFIEGNRTVNIDVNTTVGSITIESGSTLGYTANNTLTVSSSLTVNGTFNRTSTGALTVTGMTVNSGGKYIHAVNNLALPTATWNSNSTLEVTGVAANALTGLNQTFGNVIWNCTGQTITDMPFPNTGTMTIAGDLTITSTGNSPRSLLLNQTSLSVRNYTQSGGIFNLSNSNSTRTLNVSNNFTFSGGTLQQNGGNTNTRGAVVFTGTTTQVFTSGGTLSGKVDFTINTGAIVDFGTNIISSGSSGDFDLKSGGTLITANSAGLVSSGATGTVQLTGTRSYSNNATTTYTFNGSVAQSAGTGYSGGGDLNINNASGVSLAAAATISGNINIGVSTPNSIFADNGFVITSSGANLNLVSGTYRLGSSGTATSFPSYASITLASGTTVEYASGVAQTVSNVPSYQNLTFSGAGQKNVSGTLSVAGNWSTSGGLASLSTTTATVAGNITGSGNITLTSGTINTQGNWTNTGTLTPGTSTITFDGAGAQTIGNTTALTFNNVTFSTGGTKTLGAAITANGVLTIDNGVVLSTANNTLTLQGDFIDNGDISAGSSTVNISGTATQSIDAFATGGAINMTKTGGVATFMSDIEGGSLNINGSGGTLNLGTGNTITISGNWTNTVGALNGGSSTLLIGGASSSIIGGTFTAGTGTVSYNADGTQNIVAATYYNLMTEGSTGIKSLTGTTVVNNQLTVGAATTLELNTRNVTVSDTTYIFGTLSDNNATGTNVFTRRIILSTDGVFSSSGNAGFDFRGGVTNNGTMTATGSGTYTFSTNPQTIDGVNAITFGTVAASAAVTNNGTVTINTALSGASSWIQGVNSTLNFGGSSISVTTFTATANGNTVNYNASSGSQTIRATTYHNLTSGNSSGTNVLGGDVVVANNLTISSGAKLGIGANTITLNGTFSGSGTGVLSFNGTSSNLTIAGSGNLGTLFVDQTTPGTTNKIATFTINRIGQTVALGNTLEVGTSLVLTSGKLGINGQTLTLSGNITATGSNALVGSSTSQLSIAGSGAMNNLFFDQTTPGSTNQLQNITYNRSSGTMGLGNALQVTGTVTPTAGTFASNGFLTLVSNALGTARIANGGCTTCSYITGNVNVQRFIPAVARRWRFLGSTVQSTTLADLKNETYVTGTGGAANGFDATGSNAASVFSYDETQPGDINTGWTAATHITNVVTPGKGYRMFIRGDRSNAGRLNGTVADQNAVTLDWVGVPNQGNVSLPVSFTANGLNGNDGWNLVSNPYASPYDWKAFYTADSNTSSCMKIDPTIWVLNAQNGGYASYNAKTDAGGLTGGIIPAGASFWVKAYGSSPALIFKEQYKVATNPIGLFKTNENEGFNIQLFYDSITWDDVNIKYKSDASSNFDMYDIRKLNGTVTVSTYGDDNIQLAFSCRPVSNNVDTIKLNVSGAAGAYKLKFTNSNMIAVADNVWLFDTYTSSVVDLKVSNVYDFTIVSGVAASQGLTRFYILVGNSSSLPVKLVHFTAQKTANKQVIIRWATAQEMNSKEFVVERSSDGKQFKTITTVAAAGNTHTLINYEVLDESPLLSNYYRLKQVDVDGTTTYSTVRYVELEELNPNQLLKLYPIPANDMLTIEHKRNIKEIKLYDATGKSIVAQTGSASVETIDVSHLQTGVYIIEILDYEGQRVKQKFTKE